MVKLTKEIKDEMAKVKVFMLATSSSKGVPNVVPIGMLFLQDDDETVWIVDNFMGKTLANMKENPVAAFPVWSPDGQTCYQIKGRLSIENSGPDYEKAVAIAHAKNEMLPAKNLIKMSICQVFSVKPGPDAGKRVL